MKMLMKWKENNENNNGKYNGVIMSIMSEIMINKNNNNQIMACVMWKWMNNNENENNDSNEIMKIMKK